MTSLVVDIAFWVFGLAGIWFGWRVFRTDSMVRASFALLASFLGVAAMMILMLAEYLGAALFFMMAIEMVVMALFMVAFMMNPAGLNPMMVHQHRTSIGVGIAGGAGLVAVALFGQFPSRPVTEVSESIANLGMELLGDSMLVFESAGVALLATMIGAVILSARSSRYDGPADEGSHPPPIEPGDP
ncbi:MAG: NADH-quinone oxidoreductase subunit J, partial [Bradymonadaceae bacterium]